MSLNTKDLALLLALEEDPFITITKLAKKLKISRPTARKRLNNLKEKGMLRNPTVLYTPEKLGLERKHIFAEVQNEESLKLIEKAGKIHPYTRYRARTFGGRFGIYMQFEIPPKTQGLLQEFFTILKSKRIIKEYKLFESSGMRNVTYPDLNKFNSDNLTWNFSWEKWFDSLNQYPTRYKRRRTKPLDQSEYKPIRFNILRELSSNATVKQSEIKDKFNISKTEAHRHYNYVMEKYVDQVRLMYDRKSFNLTETYLALATSIGNNKQTQLFSLFRENPPPFHFSMDILKSYNLLMWGNMSSSQATDFAFSIWKTLENVEIYILNTKGNKSAIYLFYPYNFDFEEEQWKKSREYMVLKPLQKMGEDI